MKHFLKEVITLLIILLFIVACDFKVATNLDQEASVFEIDHYAINVTDLDRSVAFYEDIFNLKEIKNGTELDYIRWFRLGKAAELHIIEVDSLDKKIPKGVHIALRTGDFNSFRESLKSKNIPYSDWLGKSSKISNRPDGVRQLYIRDLDGYWIEVNDAN